MEKVKPEVFAESGNTVSKRGKGLYRDYQSAGNSKSAKGDRTFCF